MRYSPKVFLAFVLVFAPFAFLGAANAATLGALEGTVELTAPSGRIEARPFVALPPGTHVKTGVNSSALIVLDNGSKLKVSADSDFAFEEESQTNIAVSLLRGMLSCWIHKLESNRRMSVRSPGAVAAVRGTDFTVSTDGSNSEYALFEGTLEMTDSLGHGATLLAGERIMANTDKGFLSAASPLPPGTVAPTEPKVKVTLLPAPKAEEKKEKKKEEKKEQAQAEEQQPAQQVEPASTPIQTTVAPPSSAQQNQQTTVSPSSP